jgi:putative transposase
MDQITHEVRLAHWTKVIEECSNRPAGQSAKQWLKENNIPEKSYYYWLRRIRANAYAEAKSSLTVISKPMPAVLAEIPVRSVENANTEKVSFEPAIVLKTNDFTIEFSNSASKALISKVMEGIQHAR